MPVSPPSQLHRLPALIACGATDVGPVRSNNEDNFLLDEALGLAMVADGMGGHAAGEVASSAVLEALRDFVRAHAPVSAPADAPMASADAGGSAPQVDALALLHEAIAFANRSLYSTNQRNGCADGTGMGTTLTGFWRPSAQAALVLFHVGDSRLYRMRHGRLEQLTRDQTLYQEALDAGMVENLPPRNVLLQAMGPSATVTADVRACAVQAGDVLMLCSDGLYGSVPDEEIEAALSEVAVSALDRVCATLIARAIACGGRDNITVLIGVCQ